MSSEHKDWFQSTRKIIGVGPNFRSFRAQRELPDEGLPFLFLKSPDSLTGAEHIYLPSLLTEFVCEVELAVVIGQDVKRIREEEVSSIVAGCALVNDITATAHLDTGRFKMFDQTTPIGPLIPHINPADVTLEMWVNGELKQQDHTSQLLFSANWLISHLSEMMTLRAGDMILTGTPANPQYGRNGDVIELISPQLGCHKHIIHWNL
ncbi:fumarylacetoacetate hydrolase family protein [Paenibacillus sp. GCM10023252]|uniref:fumarylacetoacetate hydrolase family protein n=1 Tax=Paenibacillus sp. GCM10023252 TaxID=3252649 RepID=UPI00360ABD99